VAAVSTQEKTSREEASRPAGRRSVAGRRRQTWASRWNGGQPEGASATSRSAGSEVISYLIAGLLAYGGIGWVVAHFTHMELFIPIGMAVGVAISLGWVVYKYGRQR
jgi:ATP synthase protein I